MFAYVMQDNLDFCDWRSNCWTSDTN